MGINDQRFHFGNSLAKADEYRTRDDGVADIQLFHVSDGRHWCNIQIIQTMAAMQVKALGYRFA